MDLSEKIKQILIQKNISPSIFADEIGIQRSSMSHIIAGRNKPSLDIVQKIVKRFPDLGINWILDEEELPKQSIDVEPYKSRNKPQISANKVGISTGLESNRKKDPATHAVQENVSTNTKLVSEGKTAERILIFYTDGTFQEFKHF